MPEVSVFRLYLLRAMYLILAAGAGSMIWPLLLGAPENAEHFRGVTWSLLGALSALAALGLRYPLKMLPLLLFELGWKLTWVVAIGVPLWRAGTLQGDFADTWFATLMGVVLCTVAIPWGYVARTYIRASGDPWSLSAGRGAAPGTPTLPANR